MEKLSDTMKLVAEFHQAFHIFELPEPGIPPLQSQFIRFQLIAGELSELGQGLAASDSLQILDALCDLQYVIDGTRLVFGVREEAIGQRPFFNLEADWQDPSSIACFHNILLTFERFVFQVANGNFEVVRENMDQMEIAMHFSWCRLGFMNVRAAAFAEVHRSNMSKLDALGRPIVNANGKVFKSSNFFEPNLQQFLS